MASLLGYRWGSWGSSVKDLEMAGAGQGLGQAHQSLLPFGSSALPWTACGIRWIKACVANIYVANTFTWCTWLKKSYCLICMGNGWWTYRGKQGTRVLLLKERSEGTFLLRDTENRSCGGVSPLHPQPHRNSVSISQQPRQTKQHIWTNWSHTKEENPEISTKNSCSNKQMLLSPSHEISILNNKGAP